MLLDQIFGKNEPFEIVIVRKNGEMKHVSRRVKPSSQSSSKQKPMFPISKERK